MIAAGAVVKYDVDTGDIVAGVPAKSIKLKIKLMFYSMAGGYEREKSSLLIMTTSFGFRFGESIK